MQIQFPAVCQARGRLETLKMLSANGRLVPLSELVSIQHTEIDRSIDYKNLLPVVYAIGDVPDAYRKRGYFTR